MSWHKKSLSRGQLFDPARIIHVNRGGIEIDINTIYAWFWQWQVAFTYTTCPIVIS